MFRGDVSVRVIMTSVSKMANLLLIFLKSLIAVSHDTVTDTDFISNISVLKVFSNLLTRANTFSLADTHTRRSLA